MTKSCEKRIIIVGASFTTSNMGVWALASGAIKAAKDVYPNADINLLDYNLCPVQYRLQGIDDVVNLINLRFSKNILLKNNILRLLLAATLLKFLPSKKLQHKIIENNEYLHQIYDSDIICSVAGGDSFSDIYGTERLLYVCLPLVLVLILDKPLILLPQTIGPFASQVGKVLSKIILRNSKAVYSRDFNCIILYNHIRKNIKFCYDLGFLLEPKAPKNNSFYSFIKKKNLNIVGINVSGLLYSGGYTKKNMFNLRCDYQQFIEKLISHFIQSYNVKILLIPHVFGENISIESDTVACRMIYYKYAKSFENKLFFFDDEFDHQEIKFIIGLCDFFIGSRMHSCIGALSQAVPAVGAAYSDKFRGVFETIGMDKFVVDLRKSNCEDMIRTIDNLYQNRHNTAKFLHTQMPKVIKRIYSIFQDMTV